MTPNDSTQSHGSLEQWDAAIRDGLEAHRLAVAKQGPRTFYSIATLTDTATAQCRASRLKEGLQNQIGPEYGELLGLLKTVRTEITTRIPDFTARRQLWYRIVDSEVLSLLRRGDREAASQAVRGMIEEVVAGLR